ncbi:protein (fungal and plant) [Hirsutella rhossiliensis]|uniref:Protein (Fungal and plant) n=1 Tax=Hirsutella rhossiliensis TaxID=111463 RepID=A0A9P8SH21_9HYPO|nr:protein (fungal and plant) [Hirsutella rhossiliensis]KAH0961699.1 protein (fungal and plant) [Hirsutella rhossiliensis]
MPAEDNAPSPQENAAGLQDREAGLKHEEAGPKRQLTLPAWLDHFNSHDLKIVFRCWAATWVASILIFLGPTLRSIGVATFFGAIILYIVPPASILFLYLLAAFSALFGMCLAWAWGLVAMKAALDARPASETQARLQALQQQAAQTAQRSGESVAWEAQKLVHDGFMLDARITVVFYVFCCVFVYALTRLRYNNPKLTLTQIFGVIVIDIFLLIGLTLTTFNASLASLLVKPGTIGIGLGAVCCLLFFPQSTSYAVLHQMEKLIRMTETSLDATRKHLASHTMQVSQLAGARYSLIAAYKSMEPALAFLPLDLSRGRWNADDVKSLQVRVREVMLSCLSLLDFHITKVEAAQKRECLESQKLGQGAVEKGPTAEQNGQEIGRHQLLESANLLEALKSPEHGLCERPLVS